MAVASGGARWFVMRALQEAGLTDMFDAVVCAGKRQGAASVLVGVGGGRNGDRAGIMKQHS